MVEELGSQKQRLFYHDRHISIINADCRSMDELADESVQMVVTSPPYWGLRKYAGLPDLIWGGDKDCEHQWVDREYLMHSGRGDAQKSGKYSTQNPIPDMPMLDNTCSLCGAWKGSYGLEPTPEIYIEHTIEILKEIRRVLRSDGVVFWNIGDSYGTSPPGTKGGAMRWQHGDNAESVHNTTEYKKTFGGVIKPKDLCLIPFRVAIAAQANGWWVRSVIIWSKPNPMPESVTDRPTESHEYILMLTKSARYYFDADAVREPNIVTKLRKEPSPRAERAELRNGLNPIKGQEGFYHLNNPGSGRNIRSVWEFPEEVIGEAQILEPKVYHYEGDEDKTGGTAFFRGTPNYQDSRGRNLRSVWNFPTQPYPLSHFAVFPEKLPEICIKAATPEVGCCSKCGAPWERIIERISIGKSYATGKSESKRGAGLATAFSGYNDGSSCPEFKTLGWRPTCSCNADKVPSLCLDPFAGAGTTLWVAKRLNRKAVGYELSEEYCQLALERNRQQVMELKV